MTLDDLTRQAADATLTMASVDAFCQREHLDFVQFSARFARLVAASYHQGSLGWSAADAAMNHFHGVATGHAYHTGEWLSDFADSVYLAFDAGEYHPLTPHLSADEVTRPLVESLLAA